MNLFLGDGETIKYCPHEPRIGDTIVISLRRPYDPGQDAGCEILKRVLAGLAPSSEERYFTINNLEELQKVKDNCSSITR